jgi:hypothetical protein
MKEKDIQIVQDTKIIQQILKTIPENMHNQINVIMVNQVNQGNNGNGEEKNFDFFQYFESLPHPRLRILTDILVAEAAKRFVGNTEAAGRWLGGSRRLVTYRREKMMVEDEMLESLEGDLK